ncbi:MAG: hypothetical protein LRY73_13405 [Bacillus sp. (in: Bacteria)]|nr:hypothetical protein [Bacillus sp. (in: firmicutes)]
MDELEAAQQKEVMTMLINIHKKVDHFHYDVDYLRDKISNHDMDIERLKKQVRV